MKRHAFAFLALLLGCGLGDDPGLDFHPPIAFDQPFLPPAGYYQQAESLSGPALIHKLQAIIGGHVSLSYDDARDAMFNVVDDLDNDDVIQCILTGKQASGVSGRTVAFRKGFNTEHVWPQSIGAEGPAKSDLHHLFSSEIYANGLRGNHPYLDVARTIELLPDHTNLGDHAKLGTTPNGLTAFEPPGRFKGNIARATLYFYVRYASGTPSDGAFSMRNFQHEKRQLLAWHRLDPVDDAERARNQAVFGLQRNRNPFIDHPEFVDRLAEWLGS